MPPVLSLFCSMWPLLIGSSRLIYIYQMYLGMVHLSLLNAEDSDLVQLIKHLLLFVLLQSN